MFQTFWFIFGLHLKRTPRMENPQAFPVSTPGFTYGDGSMEVPSTEYGMTLRDYFAAKAMNGICADGHTFWESPTFQGDPEAVAIKAYQIADAMLKARAA